MHVVDRLFGLLVLLLPVAVLSLALLEAILPLQQEQRDPVIEGVGHGAPQVLPVIDHAFQGQAQGPAFPPRAGARQRRLLHLVRPPPAALEAILMPAVLESILDP